MISSITHHILAFTHSNAASFSAPPPLSSFLVSKNNKQPTAHSKQIQKCLRLAHSSIATHRMYSYDVTCAIRRLLIIRVLIFFPSKTPPKRNAYIHVSHIFIIRLMIRSHETRNNASKQGVGECNTHRQQQQQGRQRLLAP